MTFPRENFDAAATTAWADTGIAGNDPRHDETPPGEITLALVATLLRGAYVDGYLDGLKSAEPLTILDACQRAAYLKLRIPVD